LLCQKFSIDPDFDLTFKAVPIFHYLAKFYGNREGLGNIASKCKKAIALKI